MPLEKEVNLFPEATTLGTAPLDTTVQRSNQMEIMKIKDEIMQARVDNFDLSQKLRAQEMASHEVEAQASEKQRQIDLLHREKES